MIFTKRKEIKPVAGDIIKMIKALPKFDKVGDYFKVTNISNDGIISFECEYGVGCMTKNEFRNYFRVMTKYRACIQSSEDAT